MVRVLYDDKYSVYVYAEEGQPHHPPHCHVRWSDGATAVRLRTLELLAGDELPGLARSLLRNHIDELVATWERLNPERPAK